LDGVIALLDRRIEGEEGEEILVFFVSPAVSFPVLSERAGLD
jgi:hypothetical protein